MDLPLRHFQLMVVFASLMNDLTFRFSRKMSDVRPDEKCVEIDTLKSHNPVKTRKICRYDVENVRSKVYPRVIVLLS